MKYEFGYFGVNFVGVNMIGINSVGNNFIGILNLYFCGLRYGFVWYENIFCGICLIGFWLRSG